MRSLLFLVATASLSATESTGGVHRLPITRTIIEFDWRWIGVDPFTKQHPIAFGSQQPLAQQLRDRKRSNGKHSKRVSGETFRKFTGGEDEIDFWSIYTAPIRLGNPPLNLDALIDTSWSYFFAPSANCTYDAREMDNCIIHPLYNSSLSSTYRADLSPCKMVYWGFEGIETHGKISQDSLHVSGLEIKNQVFEEATHFRPGMLTSDDLFDTVLGLALHPTWDKEGNFSAPGPFQNMVTQGLLRENVFSLTLPRVEYEQGEIVFGGLPENVTREDLVEVPLNNTRLREGDDAVDFYTSNGWQVLVENIAMTNGSSDTVLPILTDQHIAVVTTTFWYIGLPREAAEKANQFIGLDNGRTWVDCSTRSSLPDLVIAFGAGKQIRLTAKDYLLEVYDVIFRRLKCVSTFVSLGEHAESGMILLGSPFLTGLYSVFDADRKSISFGNRPI